MICSRTLALLLLSGLIVIPAGQSFGQIKYVDENGQSHWVGHESQIPEKYRGKIAAPENLPSVRARGGPDGSDRLGPYVPLSISPSSRPPGMSEAELARENQQRRESETAQQRAEDQAKKSQKEAEWKQRWPDTGRRYSQPVSVPR